MRGFEDAAHDSCVTFGQFAVPRENDEVGVEVADGFAHLHRWITDPDVQMDVGCGGAGRFAKELAGPRLGLERGVVAERGERVGTEDVHGDDVRVVGGTQLLGEREDHLAVAVALERDEDPVDRVVRRVGWDDDHRHCRLLRERQGDVTGRRGSAGERPGPDGEGNRVQLASRRADRCDRFARSHE